MNLAKLQSAIEAVCPVHGVSIGEASDKSTWGICFKDGATQEQKSAAQSVIDSADVSILEDIKYVPIQIIVKRLTAIGKTRTVWEALDTDQQLNFLTLREGVDVNDTVVRSLLSSLEIDPDTILY